MNTADFDTIVIGSGAGGLASAICLARAGQKVLVLEQHDVPGGWCHSFQLQGQRFSPGVHYIGLLEDGESTNALYKGLGAANDLVFFRMNPQGYEHCWIGNEKIDMPAGLNALYESLSKRFPAEKKRLKKYLTLIRNVSRQAVGALEHALVDRVEQGAAAPHDEGVAVEVRRGGAGALIQSC